jgi:hypothetical protein
MSKSVEALIVFLAVLGYVVASITLIWAWFRWIVRPKQWSAASCLSLAGLSLASASAVLAGWAVVHARKHGFEWYDPLLLSMMLRGLVLSSDGLVLGLAGIWRRSVIRWQTPLASVATAAFWLPAAALE